MNEAQGLAYGKASVAPLSILHTLWEATSLYHEHTGPEIRSHLSRVPVRVRRELLDMGKEVDSFHRLRSADISRPRVVIRV